MSEQVGQSEYIGHYYVRKYNYGLMLSIALSDRSVIMGGFEG